MTNPYMSNERYIYNEPSKNICTLQANIMFKSVELDSTLIFLFPDNAGLFDINSTASSALQKFTRSLVSVVKNPNSPILRLTDLYIDNGGLQNQDNPIIHITTKRDQNTLSIGLFKPIPNLAQDTMYTVKICGSNTPIRCCYTGEKSVDVVYLSSKSMRIGFSDTEISTAFYNTVKSFKNKNISMSVAGKLVMPLVIDAVTLDGVDVVIYFNVNLPSTPYHNETVPFVALCEE